MHTYECTISKMKPKVSIMHSYDICVCTISFPIVSVPPLRLCAVWFANLPFYALQPKSLQENNNNNNTENKEFDSRNKWHTEFLFVFQIKLYFASISLWFCIHFVNCVQFKWTRMNFWRSERKFSKGKQFHFWVLAIFQLHRFHEHI